MSISVSLSQFLCFILPVILISISILILQFIDINNKKIENVGMFFVFIVLISVFIYLPTSLTIYYKYLKPYENLPLEWKELVYNCQGFWDSNSLNEADISINNKKYKFWKNRWNNPSKLNDEEYKNIKYFMKGHFSDVEIYREIENYYEILPNKDYWKAK